MNELCAKVFAHTSMSILTDTCTKLVKLRNILKVSIYSQRRLNYNIRY